ncbi:MULTISPECIES: sensor histidine kinase [unclassified Rathayibacter]|uniref:sensor histidine kinase n=1 Tax=unclassified Rathayibacter TaxID=2609250 RepID=UPI001049A519|nr:MULTISPECIES: sensor histidine kinase [unclassified Rathayibacter]TCL85443.1 sensor histidine kinase regulating citrate/malate metabolism [Rathayibacter sp. PhB192]TCM31264.1 sensor histidine kinase regulating citrate/malate metabolism [Rathayibacter sp. PhB179]
MPGTSPRGSIAARLFAVQLICILVIGAIAVLVLAFDARGRAGDDAAQRSLVVARTVADNPFVLDAAQGADPSASLQPYAEEIMADTGVDFLTIMNPDRTRYTHRDRAQIGLPFIGTIAPALEGRTFTETYTGTLGPSVRAVAPIESADGTVVALVSAGVTLSRVDASFLPRLQVVAGGVLGAVALGGIGSWLLARYLRRVTGGRGPEQMSQVFAYYESVLHSVREGLLLVDDRGRLVLANDHALELLGLEGVSIPVPVAELDLPDALRAVLLADEPVADRLVVAHERILVVNERPAASPGARPLGTVTTLRDRTELQRVSGELESMRTLSDALRSQTHEFSNRLHTIASLIELGRPEEALAFAAGELNLSQRLADRVLGSVQEPVIAALLLGKAAQARERGVELHLETHLEPGSQGFEPGDLVTVLGNLIDNALDAAASSAADREPWVEVYLGLAEASGAEGAELVLQVSDSGPGVAEAADVFARGYSTKESDAFGRGIGLALVRQVVQRLGGSIEVTRHVGAVFTVQLPLRDPAGATR